MDTGSQMKAVDKPGTAGAVAIDTHHVAAVMRIADAVEHFDSEHIRVAAGAEHIAGIAVHFGSDRRM